jgi:hypothetical protein
LPTNAPPYRRLPGGFRGFIRKSQLWLGDDHILLVDSTRFSETYRRFYLRDVQSIIIRRTSGFVVPYYWVLLAAACIVLLLISIRHFKEWLFWPPMVVLAAVAVYLYVANVFRSCTCHLITRVNSVQLRPLFRLGSAQRFLDQVYPMIAATQGELPAGWVERAADLPETETAADRNPDAPVDLVGPAPFSWLAVVVFLLSLVDAGITWLVVRRQDATSLTTPNLANMTLMAVCATIAIVQLTRRKTSPLLRNLVLVALAIVAGTNYAATMIQSLGQQLNTRAKYRTMLDYPGMRELATIEMAADIVVAVAGMIVALRSRPRNV